MADLDDPRIAPYIDAFRLAMVREMDDDDNHHFSASNLRDFYDQALHNYIPQIERVLAGTNTAAANHAPIQTIHRAAQFLHESAESLGLRAVRDVCLRIRDLSSGRDPRSAQPLPARAVDANAARIAELVPALRRALRDTGAALAVLGYRNLLPPAI